LFVSYRRTGHSPSSLIRASEASSLKKRLLKARRLSGVRPFVLYSVRQRAAAREGSNCLREREQNGAP
jgi:hypothetical protein